MSGAGSPLPYPCPCPPEGTVIVDRYGDTWTINGAEQAISPGRKPREFGSPGVDYQTYGWNSVQWFCSPLRRIQ